MSSTDTNEEVYRLQWQGSNCTVDLPALFRDFKENEELLDVSLECSVSDGGSVSVKAHKVMLSAYSNVFKDMFTSLRDKNEHFIYMKGISHENLSSILDFVYQGFVDVPKSRINAFLGDAEELQIKGLANDDKGKDSDDTTPPNKKLDTSYQGMSERQCKSAKDKNEILYEKKSQNQFKNISAKEGSNSLTKRQEIKTNMNDILPNHVKQETKTQRSDFPSVANGFSSAMNESKSIGKDTKVKMKTEKLDVAPPMIDPLFNQSSMAEINSKIDSKNSSNNALKCESRSYIGESPSSMKIHSTVDDKKQFRCDECGLTFTQAPSLRSHVNTIHNQGLQYNCPKCGRQFNKKSNVVRHMKRKH